MGWVGNSGENGVEECTTGSTGLCSVDWLVVSNKTKSVTITVDGVVHSSLVYEVSENHDPDGDIPLGGTSLTVFKPRVF